MSFKMIKSEIKLIIREPMSLLLYIAPVLLVVLLTTFSRLFLNGVITIDYFNMENYLVYVFSFACVMVSGLMGIITGLSMIDDQDSNIYTLVKVTPYGLKHYFLSRLLIPGIYLLLLIILASTFILFKVSVFKILFIIPFILMDMLILGGMIFIFSPDKVMALTYAKGLNILLLFSLVPLINHPVLNYLGYIVPFTWVTHLLMEVSWFNIIGLVLTHGVYGFYFIKRIPNEI